jgi:glycyl-tRNA synthetase beta chain
MGAPLLIELLTEELPPKALQRLSQAFTDSIVRGLKSRHLAPDDARVDSFASPRRLAVRVHPVVAEGPSREVEVKGPSVKVGLDSNGQPSQALIKWAERQGAHLSGLTRASDGKQECFYWRSTVRGAHLGAVIDALLAEAIAALPIPKVMQYQLADGQTTVAFVRPAHRLVVLHGSDVVPSSLLGLNADRITEGHRFQGQAQIRIDDPAGYESILEQQGRVIASFVERRGRIAALLEAAAKKLDASMGEPESVSTLLDEVTALVEWPAVYVGGFESAFLEVPQECLILTMRTNQKYFPLFDRGGRLLPRFLIVSNMDVRDPSLIIDGNERVVRPRLADARFFFEQDRKSPLASRVPQLASVVYHAKLGTQAERLERVRAISRTVAAQIGADPAAVDRAALLAKADLLTGMVGEFPELQGIMGRYYALHDGEPAEVAQAIIDQYRPRFSGDSLPETLAGTALALADKTETLVGLFGIGQLPTGDKDPFALRRHALGVMRMLVEKRLPIGVSVLVSLGFAAFGQRLQGGRDELEQFLLERLAGYLRDRGFSVPEVSAVLAQRPDDLSRVIERLNAVRSFSALPQAQALAGANKRIGNLLRKSAGDSSLPQSIDPALLTEPAERALDDALRALAPSLDAKQAVDDFEGALTELARLRDPVDRFFEDVMVMVEDEAIRANRLALLARLHRMMNGVADLSALSAQ